MCSECHPAVCFRSSTKMCSKAWCLKLLVVLSLGLGSVEATLRPPSAEEARETKLLSRKKRYLAFPEGASCSAALCLTMGVIGNPEVSYMSYALNWGVSYDLPNYTWAVQSIKGFKNEDSNNTKPLIQRRSRRDLYEKIELAIDSMGFNGHACIARALCESSKYLRRFSQTKGTMLEEIVKTIFSLPTEHVRPYEPPATHHYDRIYRRARREKSDCSIEYSDCHFSLLELFLGRYSVKPTIHGPGPSARASYSFM